MSEQVLTGAAETPVPLLEMAVRLGALPEAGRTPALWEDQRRRWQRGDRVSVEAYLEALAAPADADLMMDLVYGEFVLREEAGEAPAADEYADRFPRCAPAIRRQFGIHAHLAGRDTAPLTCRPTVTADPPAVEPAAPAEIAGYRIIATLQSGGQGAVYRGVHPTLGRDVLIKVGHTPVSDAGHALVEEGRILAELDHPGLARVYDLRLHEGRPCLVMEFVRGADLHQQAKRRTFSTTEAAALVARIARALAVAHTRGVVHRDIKPRNILLDESGNPRVIDFGLARLEHAWRRPEEQAGVVMGTLSYMAPEQAQGEPATVRSDVFGLGGVLYFLLTGQAPYPGNGFYEVLARAGTGKWDRAALDRKVVPSRIRAVVERALAADPADRYASAEEMALALDSAVRPPRRRVWLAAAGAALVMALLPLLLWATGHLPGGTPSTDPGVAALAPDRFRLHLLVQRGADETDVTQCAPIRDGDDLRIQFVVPPGMHAGLYLFNKQDQMKLLRSVEPACADQPLSYPAEADRVVPIIGPPGNELVLLLSRNSGPITESDVQDLVSLPWPDLSPRTVLELNPLEVRSIVAPRAFDPEQSIVRGKLTGLSRPAGSPKSRSDPDAEIRRWLDQLRLRLGEHFDHSEGLMFRHEP